MQASKWSLIWPVLASIVLPLIAAYFVYPDTHLPPDFGVFPPVFVIQQPPFWLPYFLIIAALALGVTIFLLFPTWFGFKPVSDIKPVAATGSLPWWFWLGLVLTLFFWWLMWARVTIFGSLVYYAFTPMWWGFILVIDGLTYRRTAGRSLLASKPTTLIISAIVSVFGWYYFEYYDYFVWSNWYYPNGHMTQLSHTTIVALFLIAYTTVWPALFEWYTLLNTFPRLVARYSQGPKLAFPGMILLIVGLGLIYAMVYWPQPLFWVLWIGPMAAIVGQMLRKGVWNPFTAIAEGNWSPAILMALSSLFNGFFWECWNYGSSNPNALPQTNPNYWIYDIPYVNVIHIHSEMPLLGYYGYLPFGILVWVVFLWAGKVFGFNADINLKND